MNTWFQKHADDVLIELQASKEGLQANDALQRQKKYGKNSLQSARKINPFMLFASQFKDVLVIILLVSAVVSWGVGAIGNSASNQSDAHDSDAYIAAEAELSNAMRCNRATLEVLPTDPYCAEPAAVCESSQADFVSEECRQLAIAAQEHEENGAQEALLIFAIVFAIALIGFFNEYKAEKTVEALKALVGHAARVRRDNEVIEIDATELVPGDIVLLEEGQKVPADIRLLTVNNMQVDEASLTGESLPVSKNERLIKKDASLGDQKNMAFAGTFVTQGTAEGVVVETAQTTELGKIASLVNEVENEQTPMQRKLDD